MDPFKSVNDFLSSARAAKKDTASQIEGQIAPIVDDHDAICITPDIFSCIDNYRQQYGDEALRAIGLFCIGKWITLHQDIIQGHVKNNAIAESLQVAGDLAKLLTALDIIKDVASFGGDIEWRAMIKEEMGKVVMEACEEKGLSVDQFFKNHQISDR